jgi:hypothetical protein
MIPSSFRFLERPNPPGPPPGGGGGDEPDGE